MALVQLTDVIIPEIFNDYDAVNSPEKHAFFDSGIVVRNPQLDAKAGSGGDAVNLPFWKDLDTTVDPNISTDNAGSSSTAQKISAGRQIAYSANLNQSWAAADLAGELAGSDPMRRIRNRIDNYWVKQWQKRLVAATNGILADNVANDAGDMVNNVASETIAGQTVDTGFTKANFIDAAMTMGDAFTDTSVVGMHSVIYSTLVKNNEIAFIPDANGNLTIPTYAGYRVVIDDGMAVRPGTTDGFVYTTVLFGAGAFGWGAGSPRVPTAVEREESQGDGGGVETLFSRKTWLLHPFGFEQATAPASNAHTIAELNLALTWNRVVDSRKSIPMAFLQTN